MGEANGDVDKSGALHLMYSAQERAPRRPAGSPKNENWPTSVRSERARRSGHSLACEGANSALWTAADVTELLSLLLSRWARATAFVSAKVRLPEPSR